MYIFSVLKYSCNVVIAMVTEVAGQRVGVLYIIRSNLYAQEGYSTSSNTAYKKSIRLNKI